MSRVKIEDLKPATKNLQVVEMKKLYGGTYLVAYVSDPQLDLVRSSISPIADCNGNCTVR
jgi:hypothetical protein